MKKLFNRKKKVSSSAMAEDSPEESECLSVWGLSLEEVSEPFPILCLLLLFVLLVSLPSFHSAASRKTRCWHSCVMRSSWRLANWHPSLVGASASESACVFFASRDRQESSFSHLT
jgi:hypothetical protein